MKRFIKVFNVALAIVVFSSCIGTYASAKVEGNEGVIEDVQGDVNSKDYHTNPEGNDDWWHGVTDNRMCYSHYNNYGLTHRATAKGRTTYRSGWKDPRVEAKADTNAALLNNHAYYDVE